MGLGKYKWKWKKEEAGGNECGDVGCYAGGDAGDDACEKNQYVLLTRVLSLKVWSSHHHSNFWKTQEQSHTDTSRYIYNYISLNIYS